MLSAEQICRGVARLLMDLGYAPLAEVTLDTGRRVDLMALGGRGEICVVEVKSSRQDFLTDGKWEDYLPYADRFYFAVAESFPLDILPAGEGLILTDSYEAAIVREAVERPLASARRRALHLRFARMAALRAQWLADPGLGDVLG